MTLRRVPANPCPLRSTEPAGSAMSLKRRLINGAWRNRATYCLDAGTTLAQDVINLGFRSSRGCHYDKICPNTTHSRRLVNIVDLRHTPIDAFDAVRSNDLDLRFVQIRHYPVKIHFWHRFHSDHRPSCQKAYPCALL